MTTVVKDQHPLYTCKNCYETFPAPAPQFCPDCKEIDLTFELVPQVSEFGAGVVVCLAKFTEHLWSRHEERVFNIARWVKMADDQRERINQEIQTHPAGDSARAYGGMESYIRIYETPEKAIHDGITMWAQGAGDHFFDLDREKAGPKLCELADLVLEMRTLHMSDLERCYSLDDMRRVRELWKEACLEVDRQLGVLPDWGEN